MDVRVVDGKRFLVRIRAGHTLATPVTGSQPLRLASRLPPSLASPLLPAFDGGWVRWPIRPADARDRAALEGVGRLC